MQKWSERHWWHYMVIILIAILPILGFSVAINLLIHYNAPEGLFAGVTIFGIIVVVVVFVIAVSGLSVSSWHAYSPDSRTEHLLAVVDKKTKMVIAGGLKKARLRSFPFHSDYEVIYYPVALEFSCSLQPMTRNPKVIPLTATVEMKLPPHNGRELWFQNYLKDPKAASKNFKRFSFDALHHDLPQELAERMNPYDESSQAEFQQFTRDTLNRRFKVDIFGNNSMFPNPMLKARFTVQHSKNQ